MAVSGGNLYRDETLNVTEEVRLKKKYFYFVKQMCEETYLKFDEIEALVLMYEKMRRLDAPKEKGISEKIFMHFLHNTLDMTDVEINKSVASTTHILNRNISHRIFSMESWVKAISLFARGTLLEKMRHCFSVYEHMRSGFITKDRILDLLQNCMGEEEEEAVKDMLDIFMKKIDVDRDGRISWRDYKTCVLKNTLLMECFGQCLPGSVAIKAFVTTFSSNIRIT